MRTPPECPVCGEQWEVSELTCQGCGTVLRNRFAQCPFCALPPEAGRFIVAFLQTRGDLAKTASALGVGPAAAARMLDELAGSTRCFAQPSGIPEKPADKDVVRREIIDLLDRGEISAEEATRRIEEMARRKQ